MIAALSCAESERQRYMQLQDLYLETIDVRILNFDGVSWFTFLSSTCLDLFLLAYKTNFTLHIRSCRVLQTFKESMGPRVE